MNKFSSLWCKLQAVLWQGRLTALLLLATLLLVVLRTDQVNAAYLAQAKARIGYDPLSPQEITLASQLVMADQQIQGHYGSGQQAELLLVERHEEAKTVYTTGAWARRADVFIYNYDTNLLSHTVVNLATSTVDSNQMMQTVQLPFTENETTRALQIALNDPAVNRLVQAQHLQATGEPLTGAQALIPAVFVFSADPLTNPQGAVAACGLHRCGKLLLRTPDNAFLALSVLVDLSTGLIVQASAK